MLRIIVIVILFFFLHLTGTAQAGQAGTQAGQAGQARKQPVQSPQYFIPATPASEGFSPERLSRLDNYLRQVVEKGLAPNAAAFVARHGKIVYFKAFGYRNIEKNEILRKDDIFRIASQTKAITTTALMMLWEEGKFVLDDPLAKYIPAFANPTVLVSFDSMTHHYTTRPARSAITIRQLLSHMSGIPYDHPFQDWPEWKEPKINSLDTFTLAGVIPRLAKRPLLADPGDKFIYGLNTDIAGYLVEILSGMTLETFIRTRILEPLGMKDTYFYLPPEKKDRLVELYSKATAGSPITITENSSNRNFPVGGARSYYSGGAGLTGPVEDYARFAQMILNKGAFNGHRLLSRKTIELMSTNQIGDNTVWTRNDKFGLGFQIITADTRYAEPASVNSLTWGGAFCTEYTIDPKEDLVMLIYTNVDQYGYYTDLVRRFRAMVYQALE